MPMPIEVLNFKEFFSMYPKVSVFPIFPSKSTPNIEKIFFIIWALFIIRTIFALAAEYFFRGYSEGGFFILATASKSDSREKAVTDYFPSFAI